MTNFSVIFAFSMFVIVGGQTIIDSNTCPVLFSKYIGSIDELLGDWHIALLIMDEVDEKFQEQSICLEGRLLKVNDTNLIQIWNIELPQLLHKDRTEIEFPTNIIEPGLWLVQSPLGGEFRGTVMESDGKSYLIVVYCGHDRRSSFHAMTLVMSRNSIVTSADKLRFLSILAKNRYEPLKNKIVSWSNC